MDYFCFSKNARKRGDIGKFYCIEEWIDADTPGDAARKFLAQYECNSTVIVHNKEERKRIDSLHSSLAFGKDYK